MKRFLILALALMLVCLAALAEAPIAAQANLMVGFSYTRLGGSASNQFAVWIEDAQGGLVRTLYATPFAAKGGYEKRPEAIKRWVERADPKNMPEEQLDAVTGATPETGTLGYSWDLTDAGGQRVPDGDYRLLIEGTLRNEQQVLYTGAFTVGGDIQAVTMEPEYFGDDETDRGMIANVGASYTP